MPAFTPVKLINDILMRENELINAGVIRQASERAFELAMHNYDAAEALFLYHNKLIEAMRNWVTQQQWLAFAEKYPSLKPQLINFSLLDKNAIETPLEAKKSLPQAVAQQVNELIVRSNNRIELVPHGRTGSMILKNRDLEIINFEHKIVVNNIPIPLVTRKTRQFNATLCSAGSSSKREILLLEKDDVLLDEIYSAIKSKINANQSIEAVLKIVKQTTQTCFPHSKPGQFIQQQLAAGNKIIPLSDFIKNKNGLCRHHTLLNAYLLSRLVEDHLIQGEVIHHRVEFGDDSAHTWNLFVNKKDNKTYSLDSLWDDITCINDYPGKLDRLYRHDVETEIKRRQYDAPIHQAEPEQQVEQTNNQAKLCLEDIKKFIENPQTKFVCLRLFGGKSIKLDNGIQKTLPHRVAEIYEAIKTGNLQDNQAANQLLQKIQSIAQHAIDTPPLLGRDGGTTRFYEEILSLSEQQPEFNSRFQLNP
ncbi:hypothetical protein ACFORL_10125 [Legionella dresdenensis]|uniref:Dot/Icm T4SS effector n=1 Tax=Legionella dresdenensis TaxID=450200 RepID=A0ABV8CHF5_9GAMM